MKKLIISLLLSISSLNADHLKYPTDIMFDDPNVIIFVNGFRVHRMINPENPSEPSSHRLVLYSPEYQWDGFKVNDIPRFVGVHVKHSKPDMQHTVFKRLIESVPDSHGGFLKLNCLLETVRKSPTLTKLVFRWTMENAKQFGIVVGHEVMNAAPEHYMAYRAIVDDVAPEMANTFELGYVWLTPRLVGPGAPLLDRFATE